MYSEALLDLELATKLDPLNENILKTKAEVEFELEKNESALETIHSILKINPNDGLSYLIAGKIRFKNGEINKAIFNFNKALVLNPDLEEAYLLIATCYVAQGKLNKACEKFKIAKENGQTVNFSNLCQ